MTFFAAWFVVGTAIAATAKIGMGAGWARAVGGGFIWPTYPVLIAISRVRYVRRRRSLS